MAFAGDKKKGHSLLHRPEEKLKAFLVPKVPQGIETYHLTLTTILWSVLILLFGFLARYNMIWLCGSSLMIFMQYITDLLDGAIGRKRDTGLIKWGFYMDHFLDYIFLCSILISYSFLLPDHYNFMLFFLLALFGSFMVNSFLDFAATNEFRISYLGIGPTEIRLVFIIVNTLLVFCDKTYIAPCLPYIMAASAFGLFVTVYSTARKLWRIDMKMKEEQEKG
ncbi:MAG: CDP-alcohol phosphatidyltransferase family protein [Sedimentisphaeraceae bacterium JB056]